MIVAFIFAGAVAAFLVSAVAGGGAGLVLMPLLRLILPVATIPAALSIGTAASAISRIGAYRRDIRWDLVRRFVPAALPAAALGAFLLRLFEPAYVELLLGCLLLLNLPVLMRRKPVATRPLPMSRLPWLGAAAGLLSGFTGAVGVIFNNAYLRLGLTRSEVMATRAVNEVLLHFLKIGLYAAFGLLPRSAIVAGALIATAAVLASLLSRPLLAVMHEEVFRRIGLLAMIVSGAAMFGLSGSRILALHQAWVDHVAPEDEHEIRLYWGGKRRLTLELEGNGSVALERRIAFQALPPAVRASVVRTAPHYAVVLAEEVRGATSRYYEVYLRRAGRELKLELSPDGTPWREPI